MTTSFNRKSVLFLAAVVLTLAAVSAAQAQQTPNLDKHARKIEKRLLKFRPGSYVDIGFRNGSESLGSLGHLANATFQITDADNNQTETFAYNDVEQVRKGKEYIGEGSEPGHHIHLRPILIVSGAVAAGAASYLAVR